MDIEEIINQVRNDLTGKPDGVAALTRIPLSKADRKALFDPAAEPPFHGVRVNDAALERFSQLSLCGLWIQKNVAGIVSAAMDQDPTHPEGCFVIDADLALLLLPGCTRVFAAMNTLADMVSIYPPTDNPRILRLCFQVFRVWLAEGEPSDEEL